VALLLAQLRQVDESASLPESWVQALNPAGLRILELEYLRRAEQVRSKWVRDEDQKALDMIRTQLRRQRSRGARTRRGAG
jgi:hypothetical protein